jgi:hypothetical protein
MERIQIIAIVVSLLFLAYIAWLIVKGKLREEYSFVWIASTIVLVFFSFWRNGLKVVADFFGVLAAPNLIFTAAIFVILMYLLHLSITVSKLQKQNQVLSQEIALMKKREGNLKDEKTPDSKKSI